MTNKIDYKDWKIILLEIDSEIKKDNGHLYIHMLKTRCQYCGRSPKQRGKCPFWFNNFLDALYARLLGKKIISQPD